MVADESVSCKVIEVAGMIGQRQTVGAFCSLAKVPYAERPQTAQASYAMAFSWMDGRRDIREIAERHAWDTGAEITEAWLVDFLRTCRFLEKYGYIKLGCKQDVYLTSSP